jgi:hypothetical protein
MRKFKKKIIEEDLIIESNIENTEEKEDIETEHSFYISDEKFSISWDQPTNKCNRTHLSQTLEIKTENCQNKNFLVLKTEKWDFENFDDLIFILLQFKKRHEIMKKS